jgi:Ca2+-binding EF-hand superfamily protein
MGTGEIQELFNAMDQDGDHKVTIDEFVNALNKRGSS